MHLVRLFSALIIVSAVSAHARVPVENGGVILPLPGDTFIPKEAIEPVLTPGIGARQQTGQQYTAQDPIDVPLHVELPRQRTMAPQAIPTHDPVPVINTPRAMEQGLLREAHMPYTHQREAVPFKHWYGGIKAEYIVLEDWEFVTTTGITTSNGVVDFDGGYGLGGYIGYRINEHFRFDIDLDFRENEADTARIGGTTVNLSNSGVEGYALMANAYVDMPIQSAKYIIPYIGAGFGHFFQTNGAEEDASAYQGMVGVSIDLDDTYGIKTGYRYFSTVGLDFQPDDFDAESHIFEFGFYARF